MHNKQIGQEHQLNAILELFGVTAEERNRIAQMREIPAEYNLKIDITLLRNLILGESELDLSALLNVRGGPSAGPSHGPRGRVVNTTPTAVLTFSSSTPTPIRGHSDDLEVDDATARRRREKGKQVAVGMSAAEEEAKFHARLDLVSRIFGATSSLVIFKDAFGLWMRALGWRAEADITSAVSMGEEAVRWARPDFEGEPQENDGNDYDDPTSQWGGTDYRRRRSRRAIALLTSNPEANEAQKPTAARRAQDLMPLSLAYQLFVIPVLSSGSPSPLASPFQLTEPFSAFGIATGSTTQSPFQSASSTPNPNLSSPRLVTPQHILQRLPPQTLRSSLWAEFKGVMEIHSSVSLKAMGDRVEGMFEWAESGGNNEDGLGDAGSDVSTMSGKARRRTRQRAVPWPVPTLSFFAVTAAAFAIGSQARSAKVAHGFAVEGSSSVPPANLPASYSGHHLHCLSRAALLAHKQLDVPPSLDIIVAHTLGWIYRMHASDRRSGEEWGAKTAIDQSVHRELGEMVALARVMGLPRCDQADDHDVEGEGMGVWEREMRRRVWWELKYWDL